MLLVSAGCCSCGRGMLTVESSQPWGYVYFGAQAKDINVSALHDSQYVFSCRQFINAPLYISQTEITNRQYRLFLKSLLDSGRMDLYQKAYPDTMALRSGPGGEAELNDLRGRLIRDPFFDDYPVVNITPEGAGLYCEWLTRLYHSASEGFPSPVFRLPGRAEWYSAALGGNDRYPWYGSFLYDRKGRFLCNFKYIEQSGIQRNGDYAYARIPSTAYSEFCYFDYEKMKKFRGYFTPGCLMKVLAFSPNDIGLFNVSGNVSEIVYDSIHVSRSGQEKDSSFYLAVGGSFNDPGHYMTPVHSAAPLGRERLPVNLPSDFVGFRPVATYTAPQQLPNTYTNRKRCQKARRQWRAIGRMTGID